MLPEARVLRHVEHVLQPEAVAKVEDLGRAVMTVGAQQDLGLGPMAADGTDQTPDMGGGLLAGWKTRRAKHSSNKTPLAVKGHDGLEPILVVISVEQAQLLVTMSGVKGVVHVEYDLAWRTSKGRAIEPHHLMRHPDQPARVGQILHPRDRGLRAQCRTGLGITLERKLERRIIAQIIRVVAVLAAGCDHHNPKTGNVVQAVPHLA